MNPPTHKDWKWQLRHQIKNLQQLEDVFPLSNEERDAIVQLDHKFKLGITPYYLSLMDPENIQCPGTFW